MATTVIPSPNIKYTPLKTLDKYKTCSDWGPHRLSVVDNHQRNIICPMYPHIFDGELPIVHMYQQLCSWVMIFHTS